MSRGVWITVPLICLVSIVSYSQNAQFAEEDLEASDRFIDAFYSFSPEHLAEMLEFAESSKPLILYYQGWAEGGNYSPK